MISVGLLRGRPRVVGRAVSVVILVPAATTMAELYSSAENSHFVILKSLP